jgi:hypothetical protein
VDCWIVGSLDNLGLILALWFFRLIVDISLVSFIGLSLVGFIGLSLISINSLISLLALSTCRLSFAINNFSAAIIAAMAKLSAVVRKQATHGVVAAKSSASEIANAAASYYCASLLHVCLFVREKMMCWWPTFSKKKMWHWIASFGKSYLSDVLQYAKQLFSPRLPQMMKYCVMRECDNILSGYLIILVIRVVRQPDKPPLWQLPLITNPTAKSAFQHRNPL